MALILQANRKTTIVGDFNAGASSLTLASAVFTNFTDGYLTLDYDNDSKFEIIKCTVTGTAVTSITRGQDGTSDVDHFSGAKIGFMFVPSHYADRVGGVSQQNKTVNAILTNTRIQTGWYYWVGDGTNSRFINSHTFPVPFSGKPLVHVDLLGGATTATPTDQGSFTDYNTVIAGTSFIIPCAENTSTTGFDATMRTNGGAAAFTSSESIGYTWTAIGPI